MKNKVIGFLSVAVSAASILAACSSSSGGGSTADACTSYANAYVAYAQKCGGALDPAKANDFAARFATLCKSELSLKGIPDLTGELSSCASAIQGASCSTDISDIEACQLDDKTGSLANGEVCNDGLQCQSGSCDTTATSSTDGGASSDTTNCGTCVAAVADGADCTSGTCVKGDVCQGKFNSDGTSAFTCVPKPTPGDVGADCNSSSDCKTPNHCAYDDSGTGSGGGKCAAPIASGGACQSASECAPGLVCVGSTGASGSDGRTCSQPAKEGAACAGDGCDVGLTCDATTSTCTKYKFAAPGQPCDDSSILCSNGNCVQSDSGGGSTGARTGVCPTIIADGQPCDESTHNQGMSQCDFEASCLNGTCTLGTAVCK